MTSTIRRTATLTLFSAAIACSESTSPPDPPDPVTGTPASIVFITGDNQLAPAGTVVQLAPVAQVRDQQGKGVAGVQVTFSVAEGDGTVSSTPVTTNASGNAISPPWRLGRSAIPQSLRASSSGFTATVSATVQTEYSVDLRFFGPPMPAAAAAAFTAAAARIRGSVTGDLPDIGAPSGGQDLTDCGVAGQTLTGVVDDVVIYASVEPIDGIGQVLGSAGPCFIRSTGRQTIVGTMRFDSADIQVLINDGRIRDVILHEMFHVIGIGTLWDEFGVLVGAGTAETRFTGTLGVQACHAIGGLNVCPGSVPVENQGGSGTADGHWRESVFATELMTGFIPLGQPAPLSVMSIQSLGDVGYDVNQNAGDPYTVPGQSAIRQLDVGGDPPAPWEVVLKPKYEMTSQGRVTRIRRF